MKKIRIGSGAGYAGDRIEPAVELMEKGNLDYIIFECLAERTVAIGQQDKEKDPSKGYNQLLDYRMEKILPLMAKNKVKVITNMGAANPVSAAERTCEIARKLGVSGLKIACVTGDDITDELDKYENEKVLEDGTLLKKKKDVLISANVYMGAEGITKALEEGANLVITGRVSDPALTIGPLVHEFGWNIDDNPDQMGQAVLAGHLLECAGQVTGGYFADPGYKDVPETLKVSVGYKDCFLGEGEISYGGSNCMARAELAAEILEKRIALTGIELEEYRTDFIGCNSLYRDAISKEIGSGTPCEVRLRAAGRTKDRKNAVLLANEVEALYTNGPAGGGGAVKRVSEVVSVCSIFVPRDDVTQKIRYFEV